MMAFKPLKRDLLNVAFKVFNEKASLMDKMSVSGSSS